MNHNKRLIWQIPQCTCPIIHNVVCTFLFSIVCCGIWDRCIEGFVELIYFNGIVFEPGIGRGIVKELAKCGAFVTALSRTAADLDTLKAEVGLSPPSSVSDAISRYPGYGYVITSHRIMWDVVIYPRSSDNILNCTCHDFCRGCYTQMKLWKGILNSKSSIINLSLICHARLF